MRRHLFLTIYIFKQNHRVASALTLTLQTTPMRHPLSTYIETLMKVMRPPSNPIDAVGNWKEAEVRIGTQLPEDYKQFINAYGTGAIGKMPIWVFNALTPDMAAYGESTAKAYHTLFADSPELLSYPLYPETGGLLQWGATGSGDYLHWLTTGLPNEWKVVVHDFANTEFVRFDAAFGEFLLKVVNGELGDIFPTVLFERPVLFSSSKESGLWPK
jgi:hypothetical protein